MSLWCIHYWVKLENSLNATTGCVAFLCIIPFFFCARQSSKYPLTGLFKSCIFCAGLQFYARIFDSVIFQKFGLVRERKTTTTEGSWYGKYLFGLDSYFEVFYPSGLTGSLAVNFGLPREYGWGFDLHTG